jgi:hypothetical protein
MHSFASIFMCFHSVLNAETCTFGTFHMYTRVPYFIQEMHYFDSVLMCFHCVSTAKSCTFGTFDMYTRIHLYHSVLMKCTVLIIFFCFFTKIRVFLARFTCIPNVTYFIHEMNCIDSDFMC